MKIQILFLFALTTSFSNQTLAWGGRGHHTICDAATFLVQNKGLRDYLTSRPQMMGHLCNVPDFYWKSLGGDATRLGNSTHFIDTEIINLKVSEIPTSYQGIIDTYQGKPSKAKDGAVVASIPTEFGSAWWRADQFYRRAAGLSDAWKAAPVPTNSKEEQDENLAYNKSAYDFIVNIGLMGHFVGDMAQPFHSTLDYDGYLSGHGGIHAFYEDAGVSAQPYNLTAEVVETAKKLQKLSTSRSKGNQSKVPFLLADGVIEKLKSLTVISAKEVPAIYKIDPVTKKSEVKKEHGMELRTPAERKSIDTVATKFHPMIVSQMARAAATLAKIWDEAYAKVGEPKLTAYKSYKYPFTPDFVAPDYYDLSPAKAPEKK